VSSKTGFAWLLLALSHCALARTGVTCTAQAPVVIPTLRSEGFNELVSDIVINCTGGAPTSAGQPVPTADMTVQFNTAVTNRLINPGVSPFSDPLLLIDDPTLSNQNFAAPDAATNQSFNGSLTGNGTGLNFALGSVPNFYQGINQNVDTVKFTGIPVDPPSAADTRKFRITNIRLNAPGISASGQITGIVNLFRKRADIASVRDADQRGHTRRRSVRIKYPAGGFRRWRDHQAVYHHCG
jgi:hypothetical protein